MSSSDLAVRQPDPLPSRSRKRHTGFPLVDLSEAVAVLTEAIKYGSEHHLTAFATYMGHGSTNSGAFRGKLAAFRDWGLITRAVDDRVSITELGSRIALPVDEGQRSRDLVQAFKSSGVFAAVYEQAAKGSPLRLEVVARMAVHSQGVSPSLQDQFSRSFLRSAVAAGLAEDLGDGTVRLRPEVDAIARAKPEDVQSSQDASEARRAQELREPTSAAQESAPTSHRATWSFGIGDVVLEVRATSPLPPTAYRQLAEVADAIVGLVDVLKEDQSHAEHPADGIHLDVRQESAQ